MNEDPGNQEQGEPQSQHGQGGQPNTQPWSDNAERKTASSRNQQPEKQQPETFGHWLNSTSTRAFKLLLDVLLVVVGIGYIYYASRQWEAMRAAIQQTDASLKLLAII